MSLRCLFVVSLGDSKILFHKVFATVESRWVKNHPSEFTLPSRFEDILEPLLNEVGVTQPSTFQPLRDSCQKKLEAPLFWIPMTASTTAQNYLPVIILEFQSRLLCGVPYLDQLCPTKMNQPGNKDYSFDVVIVFELLSKLGHIIQISAINKMCSELQGKIQQWLPFGRASGHHHLELIMAKSSVQSKGRWSIRSKPKLDVQIKEEVRMMASNNDTISELYGTVYLTAPESEGDFSGTSLNIAFPKLAQPPVMLFHSCAIVKTEIGATSMNLQHPERTTFPLCHYSYKLDGAPVQAVLKVRSAGFNKSSIYIQLHITCAPLRTALSRLEVRLPMPAGGVHILRILTPVSQIPGTVSILKGGALLLWNLSTLVAPNNSSSTKLKDDITLNVDVELSSPDSLSDLEANILFTSTNMTVSGAQVTPGPLSDIKISQSSEMKSASYRVLNYLISE